MPGQHTFKCILRKYGLWHFQKYIQFWKVEKDFTFSNVTKKLPYLHWVTANDAKTKKLEDERMIDMNMRKVSR